MTDIYPRNNTQSTTATTTNVNAPASTPPGSTSSTPNTGIMMSTPKGKQTKPPSTPKSSLKCRLQVLWNNTINTQIFKAKFSPTATIWLLGEKYSPPANHGDNSTPDMHHHHHQEHEPTHVAELRQDIYSRPWFTYREGFPAIGSKAFVSDVGWGCMLRCGQMLISQTLFNHLLGRDFRYHAQDPPRSDHRKILAMFHDSPSQEECPFSVHNLLRQCSVDGVVPGRWLGPSMVCRAVCRSINEETHRFSPSLVAYLGLDCIVSKLDIVETMGTSGKQWCPVLILVPLRLGLKEFNIAYAKALKSVLSSKLCVGILGGKPRHSVFFIGYEGDDLIGLDPHACRLADDPRRPGSSLKSYHCSTPRKIPLSTIDPSLALGFYCEKEEDLEHFYELALNEWGGPHPLFNITE